MPNGEYGLNFSPTNANLNDQGADPGVAPIQSAIQTLSYRMPRISGGSPMAPPSLMQGQGSGGPGGMMPGPGGMNPAGGIDIEALLRLILSGQFGQMGQMGQMGGQSSAPTPNITPGSGGVPGSPTVVPEPSPLQPKTMPPTPMPQPPQDFPHPPGVGQNPPQGPPLNTNPGSAVGRPPRGRFE